MQVFRLLAVSTLHSIIEQAKTSIALNANIGRYILTEEAVDNTFLKIPYQTNHLR